MISLEGRIYLFILKNWNSFIKVVILDLNRYGILFLESES